MRFRSCGSARGLTEQLSEFVYAQTGIRNDAPERSLPNLFVIRYDDASIGSGATQHHVTPSLTPKDKSCAFQGGTNLTAGKIGRQRRHLAAALRRERHAASISINSFPASSGTGSPASRQSSIYSSIASRIFVRASGRVSPWLTHPGRAGTLTT